MKIAAFCAIALAMSASAFSQTSPPAAPTLTAGAEFKGLRLDWDTVPGATWYQLEYRAHQTGAFVQQGSNFPATATSTRFSFPLHLYDWTYARYRLAACNSAGCTRSAEVSVSDLRLDAVGYFKPSAPEYGGYFGAQVQLSADGYNLVGLAPGEGDSDTGDDVVEGGAVYVFRRGSNGVWAQRARIDLDNHSDLYSDRGLYVSMSGSGNTVAVGLPSRLDASGGSAVDVYYAKSGSGSYTRKQISRPDVRYFGTNVALSESGYVLAIGSEDAETRMSIYRSVNGTWQLATDFAAESEVSCSQFQLSRDGKTIAELCKRAYATPYRSFIRLHSGSNWATQTDLDLEVSGSDPLHWDYKGLALDETAGTIAVQFRYTDPASYGKSGTSHVNVYKRGSAGGYAQVATLSPGAWRMDDYKFYYGDHLALSGDGLTLAVGDTNDNGTGWGPRAAPLVSGTTRKGGVYVYRLTSTWKLANMVKPNYPPQYWVAGYFGDALALSGTGKTLVVGMLADGSSAVGIGGDWANSNRGGSGAIYMY
jgi:hypothetical protein